MSDKINTVILAAGKGTRLKIKTAKPLVECLGKPLVGYVVESLADFADSEKMDIDFGVVVGHQREDVQGYLSNQYKLPLLFAPQEEQLGTGHALKCFFDKHPDAWENKYTIIACADTPLITPEIYRDLYHALEEQQLDAVVGSFNLSNPKGYGRIVKKGNGLIITEEKDASPEVRAIKEVNSGVYFMKTSYIKKHINNLSNNNKSGEYYLTDLMREDAKVASVVFDNPDSFLGINDLVQLDRAREIMQSRINEKHLRDGVRIINSASVYIEPTVEIEAGTVIYPNCYLLGATKIASESILEPGCYIKNSTVFENVTVKANSYFEGASVGAKSQIGPMARLREGTQISDECKIGNFVETKKSELAKGVKVSHLSYVGDAEIGANTNIGCGFITCNYDGANKHKTIIGEDSFIGSDCQMIAPVEIGSQSYVGSGSTINKNVPDGAFAIARQRQVTKEDMAKRFLKSSKKS